MKNDGGDDFAMGMEARSVLVVEGTEGKEGSWPEIVEA